VVGEVLGAPVIPHPETAAPSSRFIPPKGTVKSLDSSGTAKAIPEVFAVAHFFLYQTSEPLLETLELRWDCAVFF
jgi:hypothetical protein